VFTPAATTLLADVPAEQQSNHIMISYNRESRSFCLKMKTELEKLGLKCWIDVENISGSSLEAMGMY